MRILSYLFLLLICGQAAAQTGPWARFDQELKDGALYREASAGNLEEVKSIVAGGGNPKMVFKQTLHTPLMAAAGSGKIEVVRYLLSLGADPNAKDWWGLTAFDRARSVGAQDIMALLQSVMAGGQPEIKPDTPAGPPAPEAPKQKEPAPRAPVRPDTRPASWPVFGSFGVGDTVRYWVPTGWRRGRILEVGTIRSDGRQLAPTEKKYRIEDENPVLGSNWYEWSGVVQPERKPFWTAWFVGKWELGEVGAHTTEISNGTRTDRYGYVNATETLQVLANRTYRWTRSKREVITGRWEPAQGQPGIVLRKGWRGRDWTLRNATGVYDWQIRKLDMLYLQDAQQISSVNGKRKTTL